MLSNMVATICLWLFQFKFKLIKIKTSVPQSTLSYISSAHQVPFWTVNMQNISSLQKILMDGTTLDYFLTHLLLFLLPAICLPQRLPLSCLFWVHNGKKRDPTHVHCFCVLVVLMKQLVTGWAVTIDQSKILEISLSLIYTYHPKQWCRSGCVQFLNGLDSCLLR